MVDEVGLRGEKNDWEIPLPFPEVSRDGTCAMAEWLAAATDDVVEPIIQHEKVWFSFINNDGGMQVLKVPFRTDRNAAKLSVGETLGVSPILFVIVNEYSQELRLRHSLPPTRSLRS